jgi:hypothetical protein
VKRRERNISNDATSEGRQATCRKALELSEDKSTSVMHKYLIKNNFLSLSVHDLFCRKNSTVK